MSSGTKVRFKHSPRKSLHFINNAGDKRTISYLNAGQKRRIIASQRQQGFIVQL
jgi:hypothetical protein